MINKKVIEQNIKSENYSDCILILYNEIKNVLISKIKEKQPTYRYITIGDLKNKALKYLSSDLQSYAIILYTLMVEPEENELYALNLLFEIYKDLDSKKLIVA